MREIEWRSTYATGFPEVDEGHRRLVEIANEIVRTAGQLDGEDRKQLAESFVRALGRHFAEEEAFLRKIGYPKVDEHAGQHRALLKRAKKFVGISAHDWDAEARQPFTELIDVMMKDIWGRGLHFRTYLLEEGLGLE